MDDIEIIDYSSFSQKTLDEKRRYLELFNSPSDYPEVPIIRRLVNGIRNVPITNYNDPAYQIAYQTFAKRVAQGIGLRSLLEEIKSNEPNREIKSLAGGLERVLAPVLDEGFKGLLPP